MEGGEKGMGGYRRGGVGWGVNGSGGGARMVKSWEKESSRGRKRWKRGGGGYGSVGGGWVKEVSRWVTTGCAKRGKGGFD